MLLILLFHLLVRLYMFLENVQLLFFFLLYYYLLLYYYILLYYYLFFLLYYYLFFLLYYYLIKLLIYCLDISKLGNLFFNVSFINLMCSFLILYDPNFLSTVLHFSYRSIHLSKLLSLHSNISKTF